MKTEINGPTRLLYLDNFRGFNSTIVPLKQVNFFVGENSTGKTSVLSLIRTFADQETFFMRDISFLDDLGSFEDMVSASAKNKTSFTVGFACKSTTSNKHDSDSNEPDFSAMVFTFKSANGKPYIYKVTQAQDDSVITLKKTPTAWSFNSADVPEIMKGTNDCKIKNYFDYIIQNHQNNSSGFRKLKSKDRDLNELNLNAAPLMFILYLASSIYSEEKKAKDNKKSKFKAHLGSHNFYHTLVWLAPIRTQPKRTYDGTDELYNPDGRHTPYRLKEILTGSQSSKSFREKIAKFGKKSSLFETINIKKFGQRPTDPFEVNASINGQGIRLNNVGYGVSQSLPIIQEILTAPAGSVIAIQQPEVHLHPRAQAALGDLIHEAHHEKQVQFILETHSDFTIDRYRIAIRKSTKSNEIVSHSNSQILFFSRNSSGNSIAEIPINTDGSMPDNQPKAYRDFFIREELDILGM